MIWIYWGEIDIVFYRAPQRHRTDTHFHLPTNSTWPAVVSVVIRVFGFYFYFRYVIEHFSMLRLFHRRLLNTYLRVRSYRILKVPWPEHLLSVGNTCAVFLLQHIACQLFLSQTVLYFIMLWPTDFGLPN